ncbi:MAG: hypothetical protein LBG09_02225, partial [Puniceicoccales bacterium]|nr:hypothetical protein [Puniceicoccales bacterium]
PPPPPPADGGAGITPDALQAVKLKKIDSNQTKPEIPEKGQTEKNSDALTMEELREKLAVRREAIASESSSFEEPESEFATADHAAEPTNELPAAAVPESPGATPGDVPPPPPPPPAGVPPPHGGGSGITSEALTAVKLKKIDPNQQKSEIPEKGRIEKDPSQMTVQDIIEKMEIRPDSDELESNKEPQSQW